MRHSHYRDALLRNTHLSHIRMHNTHTHTHSTLKRCKPKFDSHYAIQWMHGCCGGIRGWEVLRRRVGSAAVGWGGSFVTDTCQEWTDARQFYPFVLCHTAARAMTQLPRLRKVQWMGPTLEIDHASFYFPVFRKSSSCPASGTPACHQSLRSLYWRKIRS